MPGVVNICQISAQICNGFHHRLNCMLFGDFGVSISILLWASSNETVLPSLMMRNEKVRKAGEALTLCRENQEKKSIWMPSNQGSMIML